MYLIEVRLHIPHVIMPINLVTPLSPVMCPIVVCLGEAVGARDQSGYKESALRCVHKPSS